MRQVAATALVGLGLLFSTSVRAEPQPRTQPDVPPLAQALAQARAEHKVLVAEFSASWCEPCHYLAEHVLPHPAVQAALKQVVFVQYDAERGPGREAAARLRPDGFPTIIAVAADGRELARLVGVHQVAELSAWLREVAAPRRNRHRHGPRSQLELEPEIEADRAAPPGDVAEAPVLDGVRRDLESIAVRLLSASDRCRSYRRSGMRVPVRLRVNDNRIFDVSVLDVESPVMLQGCLVGELRDTLVAESAGDFVRTL